jgi:hypothetical protein
MYQLWYLKYEISSYTSNWHEIRFLDVDCGTDMSSNPLSRCSLQCRCVF